MNLRECSLFDGFSDKQLEELSKISFEKSFLDGENIFLEGESSQYLHILLEGRVDIVKANSKFGEFFLHSINPISMIAELPTFERLPFPASARAGGMVKILKIEFDIFKDKMLSNPDVSYKFIKSLLQKMKILEGFIQKELNLGAEEKIINLLSEVQDIFEQKKHVDIAKILNISPETLSRTLRKLKEQGVVELDGKRVKLVMG
jgi:CRP/FNR family transcriptional regulator, dissimilatory nitrate respiration regulator